MSEIEPPFDHGHVASGADESAQAKRTVVAPTVADAFLRLLADRGIAYLFGNAGTDFAPLIEGFAKATGDGMPVPRPVTVPHENVAVGMAVGHWLISGQTQMVMVHVNVGTANAMCGLLNAARANVPLLLTAGRTPITEDGLVGARNIHIQWAQEMFDQAGMLREAVKWEYELRNGAQLENVIDRALAIASAEPKGPVYLTLPREVLAGPLDGFSYTAAGRSATPKPPHPDPAAIERVAALVASSELPLIITTSLGFDLEAASALSTVAERLAIPVIQHVPRCMCLPHNHSMHAGYDPVPWMREADLLLVIESAVPWIPQQIRPRPGAVVVHIGVDPQHLRIPIRGFECDLALTSLPSAALRALDEATSVSNTRLVARIAARRERMRGWHQERDAKMRSSIEEMKTRTPIHPDWLAHCIAGVVDEDTILIRDAPRFSPQYLTLERTGMYFSAGAAGGLGWGMGAALGAKLAAPDRTLIAIEGDGAYIFNCPVAAHYVAMAEDLPFLTVIMDNRGWGEVRSATRHLYPNGAVARKAGLEPFTDFDERLRLERVVEAAGGHGERVTDPSQLSDALRRALRMVREDRRQVVLDVVCSD